MTGGGRMADVGSYKMDVTVADEIVLDLNC